MENEASEGDGSKVTLGFGITAASENASMSNQDVDGKDVDGVASHGSPSSEDKLSRSSFSGVADDSSLGFEADGDEGTDLKDESEDAVLSPKAVVASEPAGQLVVESLETQGMEGRESVPGMGSEYPTKDTAVEREGVDIAEKGVEIKQTEVSDMSVNDSATTDDRNENLEAEVRELHATEDVSQTSVSGMQNLEGDSGAWDVREDPPNSPRRVENLEGEAASFIVADKSEDLEAKVGAFDLTADELAITRENLDADASDMRADESATAGDNKKNLETEAGDLLVRVDESRTSVSGVENLEDDSGASEVREVGASDVTADESVSINGRNGTLETEGGALDVQADEFPDSVDRDEDLEAEIRPSDVTVSESSTSVDRNEDLEAEEGASDVVPDESQTVVDGEEDLEVEARASHAIDGESPTSVDRKENLEAEEMALDVGEDDSLPTCGTDNLAAEAGASDVPKNESPSALESAQNVGSEREESEVSDVKVVDSEVTWYTKENLEGEVVSSKVRVDESGTPVDQEENPESGVGASGAKEDESLTPVDGKEHLEAEVRASSMQDDDSPLTSDMVETLGFETRALDVSVGECPGEVDGIQNLNDEVSASDSTLGESVLEGDKIEIFEEIAGAKDETEIVVDMKEDLEAQSEASDVKEDNSCASVDRMESSEASGADVRGKDFPNSASLTEIPEAEALLSKDESSVVKDGPRYVESVWRELETSDVRVDDPEIIGDLKENSDAEVVGFDGTRSVSEITVDREEKLETELGLSVAREDEIPALVDEKVELEAEAPSSEGDVLAPDMASGEPVVTGDTAENFETVVGVPDLQADESPSLADGNENLVTGVTSDVTEDESEIVVDRVRNSEAEATASDLVAEDSDILDGVNEKSETNVRPSVLAQDESSTSFDRTEVWEAEGGSDVREDESPTEDDMKENLEVEVREDEFPTSSSPIENLDAEAGAPYVSKEEETPIMFDSTQNVESELGGSNVSDVKADHSEITRDRKERLEFEAGSSSVTEDESETRVDREENLGAGAGALEVTANDSAIISNRNENLVTGAVVSDVTADESSSLLDRKWNLGDEVQASALLTDEFAITFDNKENLDAEGRALVAPYESNTTIESNNKLETVVSSVAENLEVEGRSFDLKAADEITEIVDMSHNLESRATGSDVRAVDFPTLVDKSENLEAEAGESDRKENESPILIDINESLDEQCEEGSDFPAELVGLGVETAGLAEMKFLISADECEVASMPDAAEREAETSPDRNATSSLEREQSLLEREEQVSTEPMLPSGGVSIYEHGETLPDGGEKHESAEVGVEEQGLGAATELSSPGHSVPGASEIPQDPAEITPLVSRVHDGTLQMVAETHVPKDIEVDDFTFNDKADLPGVEIEVADLTQHTTTESQTQDSALVTDLKNVEDSAKLDSLISTGLEECLNLEGEREVVDSVSKDDVGSDGPSQMEAPKDFAEVESMLLIGVEMEGEGEVPLVIAPTETYSGTGSQEAERNHGENSGSAEDTVDEALELPAMADVSASEDEFGTFGGVARNAREHSLLTSLKANANLENVSEAQEMLGSFETVDKREKPEVISDSETAAGDGLVTLSVAGLSDETISHISSIESDNSGGSSKIGGNQEEWQVKSTRLVDDLAESGVTVENGTPDSGVASNIPEKGEDIALRQSSSADVGEEEGMEPDDLVSEVTVLERRPEMDEKVFQDKEIGEASIHFHTQIRTEVSAVEETIPEKDQNEESPCEKVSAIDDVQLHGKLVETLRAEIRGTEAAPVDEPGNADMPQEESPFEKEVQEDEEWNTSERVITVIDESELSELPEESVAGYAQEDDSSTNILSNSVSEGTERLDDGENQTKDKLDTSDVFLKNSEDVSNATLRFGPAVGNSSESNDQSSVESVACFSESDSCIMGPQDLSGSEDIAEKHIIVKDWPAESVKMTSFSSPNTKKTVESAGELVCETRVLHTDLTQESLVTEISDGPSNVECGAAIHILEGSAALTATDLSSEGSLGPPASGLEVQQGNDVDSEALVRNPAEVQIVRQGEVGDSSAPASIKGSMSGDFITAVLQKSESTLVEHEGPSAVEDWRMVSEQDRRPAATSTPPKSVVTKPPKHEIITEDDISDSTFPLSIFLWCSQSVSSIFGSSKA